MLWNMYGFCKLITLIASSRHGLDCNGVYALLGCYALAVSFTGVIFINILVYQEY